MRGRYVSTEQEGSVVTVHIADPNDENFVSGAHPMHRELRDIFPALLDDTSVAAVVIAGGNELFCPFPSVANLDALLTSRSNAGATLQREAREIVEGLIAFGKPLVAAVSAPAAGFGAQLAFLADFIVAARGTYFQDTHVRLGLTAGDGATAVWPLIMGLGRARRHVLRGHPLSAEEADELGLLAELVDERAEVLPAARRLAAKLAELPGPAYAGTKNALNQWLRLSAVTSLEVAAAHQIATYESPEFRARRDAARRAAGALTPDGHKHRSDERSPNER
jgi:enoyl-CoA hydratase